MTQRRRRPWTLLGKRKSDMTPEDYFWAYVSPRDDCWEWQGLLFDSGYPRMWDISARRSIRAHRWSYENVKKLRIPDGYQIDHLCRNIRCVNPEHLEAVTARTNIMRSEGVAATNSQKTKCDKGHPYDEANTYWYREGKSRGCRACRREASAIYREKQRA